MDELYKDLLADSKHQRLFYSRLIVVLVFIIAMCICGLIYLSAYYQNKITKLISETEFVTQYELVTDNESFNSGNITVSK